MNEHYTTDLIIGVWRTMKEQLGQLDPQVDVILRDGSHNLGIVHGPVGQGNVLRAVGAIAQRAGQPVASIAIMADSYTRDVPITHPADVYGPPGSARAAFLRGDHNASEALVVTLIDASGGLYQAMQKYRDYGVGIYEWHDVEHMSGPEHVDGAVIDQLRVAMVAFG